MEKKNDSTLIRFQRLSSSGLITVRLSWNNTNENIEDNCRYFVYMRGRMRENQALLPEEIRFNRSLCLTCRSEISRKKIFLLFLWLIVESEGSSTKIIPTTIESTTRRSMNGSRALNEEISIVPVAKARTGSNEIDMNIDRCGL